MRHQTLLNRKAKDGSSTRAHLAEAARRGSESAQEQLQGPDPPEAMLYLSEWAFALCGRSGASMEGLAPLSYQTLEAWSRMNGITLDSLEERALLELDAVIRRPERDEETEGPKPETLKEDHQWPTSQR